jgi:hypothetical protein
MTPFSLKKAPLKSTDSSRHGRRMLSRHSSVLRPRVFLSTPSASHSGPGGLPMPKAGSKRPSDSMSMVAHCLASSTGSRNASDTTFMPNRMRRVRPARAAIMVIDSRNGWRLTIRSVCQIESTPPASHMSIQRQYAEAPENGNSAQPSPMATPMRRSTFHPRRPWPRL